MSFENTTRTPGKAEALERVAVSSSCFTGSSGSAEYNFTLQPLRLGSFDDQLAWLDTALQEVLVRNGLERQCMVFRRFFCGDFPDQVEALRCHSFSDPEQAVNGAVSVVIQPPILPARVCLWVYCIKDQGQEFQGARNGASFVLQRGNLEHVWTTGMVFPEKPGSNSQTCAIFNRYNELLDRRAMTLQDNCLRTWLYVKDVDTNYSGLVAGRNEVFERCNLTPKTHYIASTGIQASFVNPDALVMMDAYAVKGLHSGQVQHLQALDHLSHTHVYGVAFERATLVAYRDRKHIIVSGTASIDSNGEVMHDGDVVRQLDRALENIAALLAQADATIDDMQYLVIYLRDSGDASVIADVLEQRIRNKPLLIVTGAVCRPNWLVEIEGMAIVPQTDDSLPPF